MLLLIRFLMVNSMLPTQTMMVAFLRSILARLMVSTPALLLEMPSSILRMLVMRTTLMLKASLHLLWLFIQSCSSLLLLNWQRKMLVQRDLRWEYMARPSLSLLSSHRITDDSVLLMALFVSLSVRLITSEFSSLLATSKRVKGTKMTSLRPSKPVWVPTTLPVSESILMWVTLDCDILGSCMWRMSLSLEARMKLLNSRMSPFQQSSSQPSLRQVSPWKGGRSSTCSRRLWMKRLEMEESKKLLQWVKKLRMDRWMTWQSRLKVVSLLLWMWHSELNSESALSSFCRLRPFRSRKRQSSSAILFSSPGVRGGDFMISSNSTSPSSATLADRQLTMALSLKKAPRVYRSAVGSQTWFITTSPLLYGRSTPRMPRISRTWNCLTRSKLILNLLPLGMLNSMQLSLAALMALTTLGGDLALESLLGRWMPMQVSASVSKMWSLRLPRGDGRIFKVVTPRSSSWHSNSRLLMRRSFTVSAALQARFTSPRISSRAWSSDRQRKERWMTSSRSIIMRQRSMRSQLSLSLLLLMDSKLTDPSWPVSTSSPSMRFLQERYLSFLIESFLWRGGGELLLGVGWVTLSSRSMRESESWRQGRTVGAGERARLKRAKQRSWLGTNSVSTSSGDSCTRSPIRFGFPSFIISIRNKNRNIHNYVQQTPPFINIIPPMKQIWLEKYRPKTLAEVYGNVEQINTLRACVSQGTIPNLILAGPPGVGKTSSVLCIVRELLEGQFKEATLQLNASDERGIDVVREQIKSFAQKKVALPPGKTKIIVLDEADSLTEGAQHALRMIISNFSESTRFVLSCNTSSKIIEPIQSRCIILRFGRLREGEVELNLKRVVEGEGVRITEQAFKTLLFIADGDMRQAVNNIQACHFASQGQVITDDLVLHICDAPSIEEVKAILRLAEGRRVHEALRKMHDIYEQGYSVYDIVGTLHKVLLTMEEEIKREKLFEMLKYVAELRKRVLEGLGTEIQLGQFLAKCASL